MGIFADGAAQPRWVAEACAKIAACGFAEIVSDDLDVAFAFGAYDDTKLDGIARLGVWRVHADGVREVVEGAPLTACTLKVRLAPGAEPRIAIQSWSRTEHLSTARNRARVLAKAAELPVRGLRDAQRFGRGWLEQCRATPENQGRTTFSPLRALAVVARNRVRALLSTFTTREKTFIAWRPANGPVSAALEHFTRLPGRRPFAVGRKIFYEDGSRIAMVEPGKPPVVLLEGSYPSVVEEYLVTSESRLYRFPDFRFERVLVEGVRYATLHKAAERWWLFACRELDDELYLYHAPKLAGPWIPHSRNPVKSDARGARPAGRLYWRNGALYRPALACAPREAMGVAVHRVLRLTPHDYAERQVETIPGVRMVNYGAELTVVDAFTRRSRFA